MAQFRCATVLLTFVCFVTPSAQSVQSVGGPVDAREFGAWLDQVFAEYLKHTAEPSVGFILIKDGRVFFQKGYGYADFRKKTPVVPNETLFQAASVSKLVTATAVMQLVESGKLRLDTDINSYLKGFQLEKTYARPVTVANLLTHTGGIDDSFIIGSVDRPADLRPLGEFFAQHPPRRSRPPRQAIVYSNWGMSLAGHLVEPASGLSFHEYVERNIFSVLGMAHSSFRNPLPPKLARSLATAGAGGQPIDKTAVQLFPSEALISTIADMGRFMIAHLSDGQFGDQRIQSAATTREMHRQHFTQHPDMPGVAYGFFEDYTNGRRALFHTGSGGHESLLYLLPEEHVGFYLVFSGDLGKDNFQRAFMDRYYPAARSFPTPRFLNNSRTFAGLYRPGFVARKNIEKLVGIIADTRVSVNSDRTLTVALPPLASKRLRLPQVEPRLFRSGPFYIAFANNAMFTSGGLKDPTAYDRLHWYESGVLNAGAGAAGLLLFASFLLVTLLDVLRSRRLVDSRLAWRVAALLCALAVFAPVPVLAWMAFGDHSRPSQFEAAANVSSVSLMTAALLAAPVAMLAVLVRRREHWTRARRVYYGTVALAACCMVPYLLYWQLLGFWFH